MRLLPLGLAFAFAVLAGLATATVHPATAAHDTVADMRQEVVHALARQLVDNFVYPEHGAAYAARLQARLRDGAYRDLPSAEAFVVAVTADLQGVHADGHLRLIAPDAQPDAARGAPGKRPAPQATIPSSGWIDDGVAYIAFSLFPGDEDTLAQLQAFLDAHASAEVLVLDVRRHRGGGMAEMDMLFPYLFAEPTPLLRLDGRVAVEAAQGAMFEDSPTIRRIDAPAGIVRREHRAVPGPKTGLRTAQVYVLTSRVTASAAEHLSLALKRTHRATLVGEPTRGAGHFGHKFPLPAGYTAFIPVGRTFDPDTDLGWEGTGVAPDVAVPAADALREALKRAGRDPELARKYDDA